MKKLIEEIGLSLNNIYKNEELSAITRAICCDLHNHLLHKGESNTDHRTEATI